MFIQHTQAIGSRTADECTQDRVTADVGMKWLDWAVTYTVRDSIHTQLLSISEVHWSGWVGLGLMSLKD